MYSAIILPGYGFLLKKNCLKKYRRRNAKKNIRRDYEEKVSSENFLQPDFLWNVLVNWSN